MEDKDQAPNLGLPNGLAGNIDYPQKFVYPKEQSMPKEPPKSK